MKTCLLHLIAASCLLSLNLSAGESQAQITKALEGKTIGEINTDAEYFGIYFGAYWCPPCKVFTPKLSAFYDKHFKKGGKFDVIFVSADHDEESMEMYRMWGNMNFPAIRFDALNSIPEITKHSDNMFPQFLILDRDGKLLAGDFKDGPIHPLVILNELQKRIQ